MTTYSKIALFFAILFTLPVALWNLYLLGLWVVGFVNDEKPRWPKVLCHEQDWYRGRKGQVDGERIGTGVIGMGATVILGIAWPFTVPIALGIGALLAARGIVRAKKAYLTHTHREDGRVK